MANKNKKCVCCKKYFKADTGINSNIGFFHSPECRYDYFVKNTKKVMAKSKEITDKEARKEYRIAKLSLKPKSKYLSEAQTAVNKWVKFRDYWLGCISCGKSKAEIENKQGWKTGGCWDAGHFQTRGAKGQLRFNLWNIHKQCKTCNGGGGRFSSKAATVDTGYRIALTAKIGLEKVEWLENNNEEDLKKGDIEYLKRVKKIFSRRARNLAKRIKRLN